MWERVPRREKYRDSSILVCGVEDKGDEWSVEGPVWNVVCYCCLTFDTNIRAMVVVVGMR